MRFSCIRLPQRNVTSSFTATLPSQTTWPPGRTASTERRNDAFTPAAGYPEIEIDGIPLRDRVWLTLSLGDAAMLGDP